MVDGTLVIMGSRQDWHRKGMALWGGPGGGYSVHCVQEVA